MSLTKLFYVSRPDEQLAAPAIRSLVGSAQVRNRRAGISGVLVYTGRLFAQAIEGHAEAVDALIGDITRDARHQDLRVLLRAEAQAERDFGAWSMQLVESPALEEDLLTLLEQPFIDVPLATHTLARIVAETRWQAGDDPIGPL